MMPIFRFIAGGWTFLWKQPALLRAAALLVFLPLVAIHFLGVIAAYFVFSGAQTAKISAIFVVLYLIATVVLTWGTASVLTVGRRLLQAKAGRTRTSFNAVQSQARAFIIPVLLTNILGGCIIVLLGVPLAVFVIIGALIADQHGSNALAYAYATSWPWLVVALLLVPPFVYTVQTILAPCVVVYEKLAFRAALARSRQLTKGRFLRTLAIIVVLGFLWLPGAIAEEIIINIATSTVALATTSIIRESFDTFAFVLWLLSLTQYYKALGGKAKATKEDDE